MMVAVIVAVVVAIVIKVTSVTPVLIKIVGCFARCQTDDDAVVRLNFVANSG